MSGVYIWGANEIGVIVKQSIDLKKNKFLGFIDNSSKLWGGEIDGSRVYSIDDIEDDSAYIIIALLIRFNEVCEQLKAREYEQSKIISFFDESVADRFTKDVFISEALCRKAWQDAIDLNEHERLRRDKLGLWYDVTKELEQLCCHPVSQRIVVIGKNEYSDHFISKLQELRLNVWGQIPFGGDLEDGDKCIEDLLYEDAGDLLIYIIAPLRTRKIEGCLLDMGLTNFKSLCETALSGTRLQDVYDPNIGYTWIQEEEIPGFVHFRKEESPVQNTYRIVMLGGSTTDATLVNIKSWPEYVYEMCQSLDNVNVEVYTGGMSTYTSTQELRKLIRDVLELNPDLVISYSGMNDAVSFLYYEPGHPMCLKYEADYARDNVINHRIYNTLMGMTPIEKYTFGIKTKQSMAQHWLKCEKMMKAICREFGIQFYGFLQPCNFNKEVLSSISFEQVTHEKEFFDEAKQIILHMPDNDYLIDFTEIFDDCENIYYDSCHVYEKGNRIIARKMMPYILKSMGGRTEI